MLATCRVHGQLFSACHGLTKGKRMQGGELQGRRCRRRRRCHACWRVCAQERFRQLIPRASAHPPHWQASQTCGKLLHHDRVCRGGAWRGTSPKADPRGGREGGRGRGEGSARTRARERGISVVDWEWRCCAVVSRGRRVQLMCFYAARCATLTRPRRAALFPSCSIDIHELFCSLKECV